MVVKAKEDLKVRHQQYLQQQEEERKKQAELAEQRRKEEEEREKVEAEERERRAQEAKEQGISLDHNQVSGFVNHSVIRIYSIFSEYLYAIHMDIYWRYGNVMKF